MSLEYTQNTLSEIEIKLHDARRKLESMIKSAKFGVIPDDLTISELHIELSGTIGILTDYYICHLDNFRKLEETEEIITSETSTNIVQLFPNKK